MILLEIILWFVIIIAVLFVALVLCAIAFVSYARPIIFEIQMCFRMKAMRSGESDVWMTEDEIVEYLIKTTDFSHRRIHFCTGKILSILSEPRMKFILKKRERQIASPLPENSLLHKLSKTNLENMRHASHSQIVENLTGQINKRDFIKEIYTYPVETLYRDNGMGGIKKKKRKRSLSGLLIPKGV